MPHFGCLSVLTFETNVVMDVGLPGLFEIAISFVLDRDPSMELLECVW